jgi:tetratricopeptide (TPR) repeat protein
VGKTRLALELARAAVRSAARVLAGECSHPATGDGEPDDGRRGSDVAGAPLEALRRPLQAIADRCRERGPREVDRLLGRRGKLLALYEPSLADLPGLEKHPDPAVLAAGAARRRLFSYLTETLSALAAARPLALILDDVQWADELTLGFLAYLLRGGHLERTPMLIVATYRSDETSEQLRELLDEPRTAHLRLGRLGDEAVAAVVGDMLALAPPPALLSRFLSEQSEGNPFFVTEYLRAAVEEGLLWRDEEGRWQVAERGGGSAAMEDYERLGLPRTVRELVERRLGRGPETAALAAAATLGRDVAPGLLGRVSGLQEMALMEAIQDLLRRQVMEEVGGGRLRFTHDKLREVAYGDLGPERRAALNRAAAEAIETEGEEVDRQPANLGRHWERAGEPAKAMAYYLAGAEAAKSRYAHAESIRLLRAYLDLAERPTTETIAARNDLGNTFRIQGRSAEALEAHQLALGEARAIGDRLSECDSLDRIGRVVYMLGRLPESCALYEQSLAIARAEGDAPREATGLVAMAIIRSTEGAFEEACRDYERALTIYRALGDRSGEGVTVRNLATALVARGHVEEGCQEYERALAIASETGARHAEGLALCGLADARHAQGRLREARALLERSVAAIREAGDRDFEGLTLGNLAALHADEGSVEEARELFARALAINKDVGSRRNVGFVLGDMATLARRTGDFVEAETLLDEAEATFRDLDDPIYVGLTLCQRGHLELAKGRQASALLAQAREVMAALGLGPESRLGRAVSQLERATEAAGNDLSLHRGECLEDVPEGLRRRLTGGQ